MIDLYEAGDYAQGITLAEKWVEQKSAKGENIYPLYIIILLTDMTTCPVRKLPDRQNIMRHWEKKL